VGYFFLQESFFLRKEWPVSTPAAAWTKRAASKRRRDSPPFLASPSEELKMSAEQSETSRLVELLRAGDKAALNGLIAHACGRLRLRARQMKKCFPALRDVHQTDDVLQNALLRLSTRLQEEAPESGRHFYNLASLQIQRELHEMARQFQGRDGQKPRQLTNAAGLSHEGDAPFGLISANEDGPASLAEWAEFHETVAQLPDDEREVFYLHWYQGLSHEETAKVLGVSASTVKRRWRSARCLLAQKLKGLRPN
jgi:RNA polymerase sigma-70 factor (ECF subfamily)